MVRSRVLVVSQDSVGERMAGPAIRAYELSRALAAEHEVVLGTRHAPTRAGDGFEVRAYGTELRDLCRRSDVVVAFGRLLADHPEVRRCDAAIVADLYDPAPFEALVQQARDSSDRRWLAARDARRVLGAQLDRGDLFLCASTRQRDLVTGMLTVRGRVNPATFDADPSLDELVAVVPFGLPADAPRSSGARPLHGTAAPFGDGDLAVLWGGGVYDWLDPTTLIDAVARADERIKVFFMGGPHPTPGVGVTTMRDRATERASELGLLGTRVVFADEWVPYDERADYLLDADVGVSLHRRHLETRYAFRTRVLDYLWAGLPIVCTDGDVVAELVAERSLGTVVPPADVPALTGALEAMLDEDVRARAAAASAAAADELTWDTVAAPLVDFCRAPRRAPDRAPGSARRRRKVETRAGISEAIDALRRRLRPR